MALRSQIAPHDCIQEYERAAREHQDAGLNLLAAGYALGIGLMGLSVEMILKAAFFRFTGYSSAQAIEKVDLQDAETGARQLGVTRSSEGFHSLLFWADLLVAARQQGLPARTYTGRSGTRTYPAVAARPVVGQDAAELWRCANRFVSNWSVGDRYKSVQPVAGKQDLEDVFDDAVAVARLYDQGKV